MKEPEQLEEDQIQYMIIWRAKWDGKEYSDSFAMDPKEALRHLQASMIVSLDKNIAEAKMALKAFGLLNVEDS